MTHNTRRSVICRPRRLASELMLPLAVQPAYRFSLPSPEAGKRFGRVTWPGPAWQRPRASRRCSNDPTPWDSRNEKLALIFAVVFAARARALARAFVAISETSGRFTG